MRNQLNHIVAEILVRIAGTTVQSFKVRRRCRKLDQSSWEHRDAYFFPLPCNSGRFEILLAGGNAIDSALATGLALHVAEPHIKGIAGGTPIILCSAKERRTLLARYLERN
jgi:hypothetical protein